MSADPPGLLAALHARAFDAPWPEDAFAQLLEQPGVMARIEPGGFILVRVVADEAEILTLAVAPEHRRQGLGRTLVEAALDQVAALGAERLFLEVAQDNAAALALYHGCGFVEAGRRRAYYPRPEGPPADALVMSRQLALP